MPITKKRSVYSAIYCTLFSTLFVKVFLFALSVGAARYSSFSDYGKISVYFQVFVNVSTAMLKEGFRKSALRAQNVAEAYFIVMQGVAATVVSATVAGAVYYFAYGETLSVLCLIWTSVVMEALADFLLVYNILVQQDMSIKQYAELGSTFVRSLTLSVSVISRTCSAGMSFAISQIFNAITILTMLLMNVDDFSGFLKSIRAPFLKSSVSSPVHILHGIEKLFLIEGEQMVTVWLFSAEELGRVGLVKNLGSLPIRLLFAPLEDILFTALVAKRLNAKTLLQVVVLLEVSIGMFALMFGPSVCYPVLFLFYGRQWAGEAEFSLKLFCALVLLFALNGPLNTYINATGSVQQIKLLMKYQLMGFFSFCAIVALLSNVNGVVFFGAAASLICQIVAAWRLLPELSFPIHTSFTTVGVRVLAGFLICQSVFYFYFNGSIPLIPSVAVPVVCGIASLVFCLPYLLSAMRSLKGDSDSKSD